MRIGKIGLLSDQQMKQKYIQQRMKIRNITKYKCKLVHRITVREKVKK